MGRPWLWPVPALASMPHPRRRLDDRLRPPGAALRPGARRLPGRPADVRRVRPGHGRRGRAPGGPPGAGILGSPAARALPLPLAGAGHTGSGLDVSPAMLDQLRARRRRQGVAQRVVAVQGDMRDFSLGRAFGFIYHRPQLPDAPGDAGGAAAGPALRRRHLQPGGRLVVDLFNPDVALPAPEQEGQLFLHCLKTLPEGGTCCTSSRPAWTGPTSWSRWPTTTTRSTPRGRCSGSWPPLPCAT